jgi:threonine/homoserine/homoserine lactone efflux protein
MNDLLLFALGTLALLATPGPTNTLLATSGAIRGIRPSLPLLLGEAAGYLTAILVLRTVAAPVMADQTQLPQILSGLVCAYLLFLSWKLWRSSAVPARPDAAISLGSVFLTTLLNPKALVFAYLLLPAGRIVDMTAWLIALLALIALCGSAWIAIGAAVLHRSRRRAVIGYRTGAVALFVLAMVLGTRASGMA